MNTPIDVYGEVIAAEDRIRPFIRQTYLQPSPAYSQLSGAEVYFKCENLQHTGSFKARGALNKVLALSDIERQRGVVTASTGNHGAAVAFALSKLNARGIVFVPDGAASSKIDAIQRLGAELRFWGSDSVEAEIHARSYAAEHEQVFISPYNDPLIIGGQGTIGLELEQQQENIDAVLVSVGGGGLISGIAGFLKRHRPNIEVIGCSPENSQVMIQSIIQGAILDLPSLPTLSDGTAGGIEQDAITFPLCQQYVDDYETVTEEEIAGSLRQFISWHHMLIEGSAAVPIAALLKRHNQLAGKRVVIVLCGANININVLQKVLKS